MRTFFGLVGLGMFLGFGAVFVTSWQETAAFPDKPVKMTVHEAVLREDPGAGAWVELTDVRFPCDQPEQRPSRVAYRLGFGETEDDRIIVGGSFPCSDTPVSVVGVLATASPGRIVDLQFPGYDFEKWPRAWQSTLWTESGPENSEGLLFLMPPFALLGLLIMGFYLKPQERPSAKRENLELDPTPWREDERVLPARELELAHASLYDRVLAFTALLIFGWMMLALAWSVVGNNWFGILYASFFTLLALFLIGSAVKAALGWRKNPVNGARTESLARLESEQPLLAQGVDVGNRTLTFVHPLSGARIERVVGVQESRPLIINGYLFLVWTADAHAAMIIAEDFTPFDLTPTEQRESMRRLIRWVATRKLPLPSGEGRGEGGIG